MDTTNLRVWATEREPGLVHLTWEWPEDAEARDAAADRRTAAAALHIRQRIQSGKVDGDGVLVRYNHEEMGKSELGAIVRAALAIDEDLKTRSNAMMRRVPTYLDLAQRLALDSRVSPLPDAANSMRHRQGIPRTGLPLHMIPGFRLASRIHAVLPALQSLATWSRDAPPEVVEHHLASAGLTREQLDLDHATAQEMLFYARAISGEKAAQAKEHATVIAGQASVLGRQWWDKAREKAEEYMEAREQAEVEPGETVDDDSDVASDSPPQD